jgi:hypothetical protein
VQHLESDLPVVLEIMGKVDRRHSAAPELTLDGVAVG